MLENVIPAKTRHIKGYGMGVTFTSNDFTWKHNVTSAGQRMVQFTEPTVIC
jgi:hypothetical protein